MKETTFYQILIIGLILVCAYLAITNKSDWNTFNNNMPINMNTTINVYSQNQSCECKSQYPIYWNKYDSVNRYNSVYVSEGSEQQ